MSMGQCLEKAGKQHNHTLISSQSSQTGKVMTLPGSGRGRALIRKTNVCQTRNLQNSGQVDARLLSARGSFGRRGDRTTAGRLSFAFPVFLVGFSVAMFCCRWKRA